MTRALYRAFPGVARGAARRDPANALDRFVLQRRLGLVAGLGFTVFNGVRGAWGWLTLTLVLLALDLVRLRRAQADPERMLAAATARHALAVEHQDGPGAVERLMAAVASKTGIGTEQAYTVVLATVVAIALMLAGLPGVFRGGEPVAAAPLAAPLPTSTPAPPVVSVPLPVPTEGPLPVLLPLRPVPTFAAEPSPAVVPVPTAAPSTSSALTILAASWATSDPLALDASTVPADGLPVEARAGQVSKVSFLRVKGTAQPLRLSLTAGPTDNLLADSAAILACRVTTTAWVASPGQPLSEAPTYDCSSGAVDLIKDPDGTWVVPLGAIPTVNDEWDLALVPAGQAGSVFRVTFQRPAST